MQAVQHFEPANPSTKTPFLCRAPQSKSLVRVQFFSWIYNASGASHYLFAMGIGNLSILPGVSQVGLLIEHYVPSMTSRKSCKTYVKIVSAHSQVAGQTWKLEVA